MSTEIYNIIKQEVKITDMASEYGYTLTKKGRYYSLKEHDSVMIDTRKNCFWQNSVPGSGSAIGRGGSVIDFLIIFGGMDKADAINTLRKRVVTNDHGNVDKNMPQLRTKTDNAVLELPPEDGTTKNIYAYLIKSRCIKKEVVDLLIKKKMLYQDANKNCVFVGYDINNPNLPVFACRRGTNTFKPFYGDVKGCDYGKCFYINNNTDKIFVAESVIDVLSFATINFDNYQGWNYLALGGVGKFEALRTYLSKNIKEVWIGTDNDSSGRTAAKNLSFLIKSINSEIKAVSSQPPKIYKDWNDCLKFQSTVMDNNPES